MIKRQDTDPGTKKNAMSAGRVALRLAILGAVIVGAFAALFSRLWFLQVLASDDYRELAKENRVRFVRFEKERGRILDRDGRVLVRSRASLAVTVDRQVVDTPRKTRRLLSRLSRVLDVEVKDLKYQLRNSVESLYQPVAVAKDVSEKDANYILERRERFRGVDVVELSVRSYPYGRLAAQVLGYVGEISKEDLASPHFKRVRPRYVPGDNVGQSAIEYQYDRYLRGRPRLEKVVVNSWGQVVAPPRVTREGRPGNDLVLSLDARIQRITENALAAGINAARGAGYQAPAGGVVVMDPNNGQVLAMASYPTYDPRVLANGITPREWDALGHATETPDDDAILNRAIQSGTPPGSTFKVVTAGAAMTSGIISPYGGLDCPGSKVYPPEGGPGSQIFPNWTLSDLGWMGFPTSLEVSCDTFYYELGWQMQQRFGVEGFEGVKPQTLGEWGKSRSLRLPRGSERFQRYIRMAGFGRPTGIDLPYETSGVVPDQRWCHEQYLATKDDPYPTCQYGWLPGYTVNLSIGQGDLIVSPLQMAVTYAAIANGGKIVKPQFAMSVQTVDDAGEENVLQEFEPRVVSRLPLDEEQLSVIRQGLVQVVSSPNGTAYPAFAGFPLGQYPVAGKTGTAEIGTTGLNYAWFESYAPATSPQYVISVYLEKAGHGGESAAPVARQIYEGIWRLDKATDLRLGQDASR